MKEVFELSFSGPNIFATILLLLAVAYWLVFLLGFLDLSFLDFDAGGKDLGQDFGDHGQGDAHHGSELGTKDFGASVFNFLNLTHVPFMVVFSFFALFYWAFSILGNHYVGDGSTLMLIAVSLGGLILALMVAKVATQPLRGVFRKLNDMEKKIDFRGRTCLLEVGVEGQLLGQADIVVNGHHLIMNVRSFDGRKIARGETCLIVDMEQGDETVCLVQEMTDDEKSN